jgi:RNA polymerase sigma factor (sigma-70 family)
LAGCEKNGAESILSSEGEIKQNAAGAAQSNTGATGVLAITEQSIKVMNQEIRRMLALGIPRGMDRDDLLSVAQLALVKSVAAGHPYTRLDIRHALADAIRAQSLRNTYAGDMPEDATVEFDESAIHATLREMIQELPARQAEAVFYVYDQDMTQKEAASEMGCSHQAVGSLLRSAIESLKNKFAEIGIGGHK